jgi:hypothetical protein
MATSLRPMKYLESPYRRSAHGKSALVKYIDDWLLFCEGNYSTHNRAHVLFCQSPLPDTL